MKQRTLAREVSVQGTGLHTGESVTLTIKPAPTGHGIVFKRIDLNGQPEIKPRVDLITDLVRGEPGTWPPEAAAFAKAFPSAFRAERYFEANFSGSLQLRH